MLSHNDETTIRRAFSGMLENQTLIAGKYPGGDFIVTASNGYHPGFGVTAFAHQGDGRALNRLLAMVKASPQEFSAEWGGN